jgi:CubicO group peptidase (beta-lactamase class C family)
MKKTRLFARICSSQRFFGGVLLLFFAVAAISPRACAQATATAAEPPNHSRTAAIEHARAIAKEWLERGIPGFSVTVAVDGNIVFSEAFGYADLTEVAELPMTERCSA